MTKTVSVSAIKNGTVIDHVPAGQALRIIRVLNLAKYKNQITAGMHLPSKSMKFKDLIKIENKILNEAEVSQIAVFAPQATVNIISDFAVSQKIAVQMPDMICDILLCPNSRCITHTELISSVFYVEENTKGILLTCKYCEKQYACDQVKAVSL